MNNSRRLADKESINNLWKGMVAEARDSVYIFAGDVSWIERDEAAITNQVKQGRDVFVICRRPLHNNPQVTLRLKMLMKRLLIAGAKVKYYEEELRQEPSVRGVLMNRLYYSLGLKVTKSSRSSVLGFLNSFYPHDEILVGNTRGIGIPGSEQEYDYQGTVYVPPENLNELIDLHELFDRIWKHGLAAFVLDRLELTIENYVELLKNVPHYSNLVQEDIKIETVYTYDLWASCQIVKDYKLEATKALLDAYLTQNIACFSPCFVLSSSNTRTILLPPILERHGNKLVIIDGMHRLYYATFIAKIAQVSCIVISRSVSLPGQPLPFDQVVIRSQKPSDRRQIFIDFQPVFFRQISALDKLLIEKAQAFDENLIIKGIEALNFVDDKMARAVVDENNKNSAEAIKASSRIKILFLGVNPQNTNRLRIDQEIRNIKQTLRESEFRKEISIEQEWAVRVTDLQKHLLNYKPTIVHLSGHGNSSNEIIFEDEYGAAKAVSGEALGQIFAEFKEDIKCVLLNVCFSESQAKAISQHIDAVIGVPSEIFDSASISFSVSFYQALGAGRSVQSAFNLGIGLLKLENNDDVNIPKLIMSGKTYGL